MAGRSLCCLDNADARDKFFMYVLGPCKGLRSGFSTTSLPGWPCLNSIPAWRNAALLQAAQEHLGNLLAELYVAMPSLAACGFKASFVKRPPAATLMKQASLRVGEGVRGRDATSAAVAAVAPALGVDTQALRALVSSTREALAQISR